MIISAILRFVLGIACMLSFLLGATLAALGVWLMVSKDLVRSVLNLVDTSKLPAADSKKAEVEAVMDKYDILSTIGIGFLVLGCFIAFIAICGGVGALCNVKLLLLVYMILTGIMFVALLMGVIYFGTLKARLSSEILKKLEDLQERYLVSIVDLVNNRDGAKAAVTVTINFMQIKLKCCGVKEIGDARNSTSWLGSERRLTELAKAGMPVLGKTSSDLPWAVQADMPQSSGKDIPAWLKEMVPSSFVLPSGVTVPTSLPTGFPLLTDFKAKLIELAAKPDYKAEDLNKLFNDALTIKTPVTCCQMSNSEELLKGQYDAKKVSDNMKDMSCAFSPENAGVNQLTCHQALMDYISKYQYTVVTIGTILAFILGGALGAASWIFFCS